MKKDYRQRVLEAVERGEPWRAKEILAGRLSQGYDAEVFELLGGILLGMGDAMQAGRYLFFSGVRKPEYAAAIALFVARHTRKDPHNLLLAMPAVLRRVPHADKPAQVLADLQELGVREKAVQEVVPPPAPDPPRTWTVLLGCGIVLAIAAIGLVNGVATLWEWLFG